MKKKNKRLLKVIAKNLNLDPVEMLVGLWNYDREKERFNYLKSENSAVRNSDLKFIERFFELKNISIKQESKKVETVTVNNNYAFDSIGKKLFPIKYMNKYEVVKIYDELVKDFNNGKDPISPAGVKNEHLLESALFHSQTSFENIYKYPTVESSGAALMYSLSNNHAFHNGNKRTAMVTMLVFLDKHNFSLNCSENELFKISTDIADHKLVDMKNSITDAEVYRLAQWIHDNRIIMKKGDRPIKVKRLKQILHEFDCEVFSDGKIERNVLSFLGLSRKVTSRIQPTLSEGQTLGISQIKQIREDLQLTSEYDIDYDRFYGATGSVASEFIIKYKNVLKRLSRI